MTADNKVFDPDGYICSECGKNCEVVIVDVGEGWSEHFGSVSFHSRKVESSHCCEADVINL